MIFIGGRNLALSIERELDLCFQQKSFVGLPLGVVLNSIAKKGLMSINSQAGLVLLLPFLLSTITDN